MKFTTKNVLIGAAIAAGAYFAIKYVVASQVQAQGEAAGAAAVDGAENEIANQASAVGSSLLSILSLGIF